MPAWLIDMTPNQNGDVLATARIGRDDVGHGDRHLGVELHRLEAVGHDDEVAGHHAMEPRPTIVDRALDAELGKDHEQAGGDAGQRQQRAGALALELLGAERHGRRGPRDARTRAIENRGRQ